MTAKRGATLNFHRPLAAYVNGLAAAGLAVDRVVEVPVESLRSTGPQPRAAERANREIPLFLGIRARRRNP